MFIYKITNKINSKVYIGQTIRPIDKRFKRHINDSIHNILDTHFARAIRKYGPENFEIELIDSANTQEELTLKEQQWIRYYNSAVYGYNETDAIYKCGGNTYKNKSPEEIKRISGKIQKSKIGSRNPNSRMIKCLNVYKLEEIFFGSLEECKEFFNESTHRFITTRVTNNTKSLYKNEWAIAYYENDYSFELNPKKSGFKIYVFNWKTFESYEFDFIRSACTTLNINRNIINSRNSNQLFYNDYRITIIE